MAATASIEDDDGSFPRPFGQYVLLENFARGGMGEVYLAKYGDVVEKYCVLKKLRKELTRDREYVTRFIDEARVVVTLNHANICHVFDVGRVDDEYYLAMEYVSGRDARTMMDRALKRERPIPAACALQLTCETLEALDYAHRRVHPMTQEALNLVHRDVSPQNVLVSFEGEVKLIDFGLAASKLKVERTQPNVVMGKMAYMAPEQARGDPIDARADLFACGVLCYELLSGERFYEGMTANDIWNVAGKGGFVPRSWDKIDPDVAKILAKALHPDARKRFATCGDFREALASHLHWRFPGSGVKSLRDVMGDLFADEIAREREMLQRFGKVTVQSFRGEMESTQSHSISLAGSGGGGAAEGSSRVVRNEQSQSGERLMPPPERDALPERALSGRDVHAEPTRVGAAGDTAATAASPKGRSTDEASAAARLPTREPTARVVRTSSAHAEPTALVRERATVETQIVRPRDATLLDLSPDERTALGRTSRPTWIGAGVALAVLSGVLAFALTRSGGADVEPPTPPAVRHPADPPSVAAADPTPTPAGAALPKTAPAEPMERKSVEPPPAPPAGEVAAVPPAEAPDPARTARATARADRERKDSERLANERKEVERKQAERKEVERKEAERKEAERLANERKQAERRDVERKVQPAQAEPRPFMPVSKRNALIAQIFATKAACADDVKAANTRLNETGTDESRRNLDDTVLRCARVAGVATN